MDCVELSISWHGHSYPWGMNLLTRNRRQGQTLVEYALIVAFASLVVMAFLTFLGQDIISFFSLVTQTLAPAAST